jgi:xanthine dehydrogenase accessory factor
MKSIYITLISKLKELDSLAYATILSTKGSTPQVPGASAIFSKEGLAAGTLGGGILENDAQNKALTALNQKKSLLYKFELYSDISADEGAICGGEATILIDINPEKDLEIFKNLEKSLRNGIPGVLITLIGKKNGNTELKRYWIENGKYFPPDSESLKNNLSVEINKSLSENITQFITDKNNIFFSDDFEEFVFIEPVFPLPKLIIAGAGHIGQAVSHLGSLLDFEVTVIDDRAEFAVKNKLPDADNIFLDDYSNALENLAVSSDTYIVIVTPGHKKDAETLKSCLNSEAAYIGMIGSKRKIKLIRENFIKKKWATPSQFDRIFAPIGIDIKSKTIQEIAVSICAQLIQVRHQRQNE